MEYSTLYRKIAKLEKANLLKKLEEQIDILLAEVKTTESSAKQGFGCAKGSFWLADDFNAEIEDFKDYMPKRSI